MNEITLKKGKIILHSDETHPMRGRVTSSITLLKSSRTLLDWINKGDMVLAFDQSVDVKNREIVIRIREDGLCGKANP